MLATVLALLALDAGAFAPHLAVDLVITRRSIVVDGVKVVDLEPAHDERGAAPTIAAEQLDGALIVPLHTILTEKNHDCRQLREMTGDADPCDRILLQASGSTPFYLLQAVMHTAERACFDEYRFVQLWKPRSTEATYDILRHWEAQPLPPGEPPPGLLGPPCARHRAASNED